MTKNSVAKAKHNTTKGPSWINYLELNALSQLERQVMTHIFRDLGIDEDLDDDDATLTDMTGEVHRAHLLDVYSLKSGAFESTSFDVFRVQVFRSYKRLAEQGYLKQHVYKNVKVSGPESKNAKPFTLKLIRITPKGRLRLLVDSTFFSRDLSQAWGRLEYLWMFYRVRSLRKDYSFGLNSNEQKQLLDYADPRETLKRWLADAESHLHHFTLLTSLTRTQMKQVSDELIPKLSQTPHYKRIGGVPCEVDGKLYIRQGNPKAALTQLTQDLINSFPGRLPELKKVELLGRLLVKLENKTDTNNEPTSIKAQREYWLMASRLLKTFSKRLDDLEVGIPAFLKDQKETLILHKKIMDRKD